MLYLLNKDVRTVRWNGEPLHEATSAIVKETMNGDFTLTVKYPISDSGIYQLIQEDMLIKAPTPVLGAQLFRIKKPVEHNDHLEITAYHISDDVMQRSITPMSVTSQSCSMALSRMVQNTKTALGDFSFNSDIQDRRTFNTTETETLYSVLLDGKHSIVGTWEGELVRDNFAMTVKKSRGENRGVVITTHKNLKDYQRTKNSQNVVTRIHAKSTFKPEGADKETTIRVTVDSPLINSYPYINEKEYENNNAKTVEELQKWSQAKFTNQGIDKVSDAIKIEAYELDGQVVHMGDTVNLKSWKHNVDAFKKAIAYEFDALKEEYISLTFDDKAGTGGSRASGGLSSAADAILGVTESAQEIALEKALQNADLDFDHKAGLLRQEISDGIELAKARAEEVKRELSDTIDQRFNSFDNGPLQEVKRRAEEALRNAGASTLLAQEAKRIGLESVAKLEAFKSQATSAQTALSGDLDALKRTIANDIRPKQEQVTAEIEKQVKALIQTKNELSGIKSAQATYEETTTRRLAELTSLADGKASKSELAQTADELASKIASVKVDGRNYYRDSEKVQTKTRFFSFPLHPYLTQENVGETWTLSFDLKINEGGEIRPLHFYHYQRNRFGLKASGDITPSKEWQRFTFTGSIIFPNDDPRYARGEMALYDKAGDNNYSVRRIKFERGTVATPWSPALEDIEGHISTVESNFKQRADSLDAGVSRLTEGLRTKADISTLNVTAENIRQSVKSLETSMQNKLDQKLSQAEFEVRASSIRQEILNKTKDKADKTLVIAEAGKLREEFSNLRFGGRNYYRDSEKVQTKTRFFSFPLHPYLTQENVGETWTLSFDLKINEGGEIRPLHFYHYQTNRFGIKASGDITPSKEWQRFTFTGSIIFPNDDPRYAKGEMALYDKAGDNNYSVRRIKFERGTVATPWSPALEDIEGLIKEAKATFERTAQGLRTDLSAIQEYVNQDGQRQEALRRYTREESAKQATSVRELVTRDFVGKATHQEDVRGIERRLEAITNPQNGSIATQIANYKTAVDGRFADISSLLSGKASQADFQRVKETSQLYERILGNTEDGIPDKIARMAMTSQLFQVEVGKAVQKGRNYYRDSEKVQTKTRFFSFPLHPYLTQENVGETWTLSFDLKINEGGEIRPLHFYHYQRNRFGLKASGDITPSKEWQRFTFTGSIIFPNDDPRYARGEMALYDKAGDNNYSVRRIKFERGTVATPWSPAPEDNDKAIRTVQSQLAGSWAVQNINSAGDIISGINLGANGHNRFDGKLTHITGETLIDKAVIKSAMIDKLKTANFEAGSVTTVVLDAEAVTAEKLKVDQAFFNKLVANEAYLSQLFAKQAFITRVQSITLDASQIKTGVLTGGRIYGGSITGSSITGGTITGSSISGATLTGHTKITLGTYGSFDTVDGGLQINVPRTSNSKDGLGVQFIGSYGRGANVPYGLYIYKDSDLTTTSTGLDSDDFLMTVNGYINAKGIGWLRTGKSSVNNKLTATLGLWNSSNVSLEFGGSGNDIYYSYNGTAYSLWTCVNAHFSDRRLKENIVDCKHKALDYIHQFQFKEYDWKKQEDRPQQAHTKIGLIAQEVQEVDPTLVYENGDTLNLDNLRLTNIALKAIQELALENKTLTKRLENLENERRTA
ncbi:TPA: tail fiber domain-containing protein [Streptococcus pneumoniae]|nr:tail fiber domain-containing protein [Streptococcus pneumoniae]